MDKYKTTSANLLKMYLAGMDPHNLDECGSGPTSMSYRVLRLVRTGN